MSVHTTICRDLIKRLCQNVLNDWKSGLATGGTTTTVIDTINLDAADDYYQNTAPISYCYILNTTDSAAPKGEERKASDFVNSTATLTVAPAYSATIGAGDTYVIIHLKRWAELKEYLNMAIDMAKTSFLIPKIDETSLTIQSDVYEYPVPSGFTHIYRLTQADDDGNFYEQPIMPTHYKIIQSASTPLIHFYKAPEELALEDHYYGTLWFDGYATATRKLRIEGYGLQAKLENDTDICYLDPNYVVAQAGALIFASMVRRNDVDTDESAGRMKVWQEIADRIRSSPNFRTQLPPDCKKVM